MSKSILKKSLLLVGLAAAISSCSSKDESKSADTSKNQVSESKADASTTDDATLASNGSYTIGYGLGGSIKKDPNLKDLDLNSEKAYQGFKDAISGDKPAISEEEIKANMDQLRKSFMEKMNDKKTSDFLENNKNFYDNKLTAKVNTAGAKVRLYEFFDYQCLYCSKVAPEIEQIMKNNKNLEVVFVELPIFSSRWDASEYAAEMATATYKVYGPEAYMKFHNAIFATGKDEGKLTKKDVDKVAQEKNLDKSKLESAIKEYKIKDFLAKNLSDGFKELGIQGTPYLAVVPTENANQNNSTVIAGYTDSKGIQAAIDKALGSTKA